MKILVVEDDEETADFITAGLQERADMRRRTPQTVGRVSSVRPLTHSMS
jgi:hypothetical protein